MFGVGELAAINAVIAGIKGVNALVQEAKATGESASAFTAIVGKFTKLDQDIREIEQKAVKKPLTVEQSLRMTVARQQVRNAMQNIKDAMLMSGQAALYKEMMGNVEASREAFERQLAKEKKEARRKRKMMMELGQYALIGIFCLVISMGALIFYLKTR